MIGAFIIVLREVIEAGLIVGIVLAATRGVPRRGAYVGFGVLGGVAGAGVVAVFAGVIADAFAGSGQEILNAVVLSLAVVMLAWHNAWMAKHGRELASQVKAVGQAVASGSRPLTALAVVCGVAVLREGSEVVLFLYGIVAANPRRTASDGQREGIGVCRDFAHLAAALCRAMNVPARYCTGYLGYIGVPADPAPMDFSAWFEVFLNGRGYTFDARHNAPRIGRVVMARGRDAADVAISTAFGQPVLKRFEVTTYEEAAAA